MTITAQSPNSPAARLRAASELVSDLDDVLWPARRPSEMLETKQALEKLRSQLYSLDTQLACEIEAIKAAAADGHASTTVYLTQASGGRNGHGNALLRVGRALTSDLEDTMTALKTGRISPEQTEVIVATIDQLPVKDSIRDRGEAAMLDYARTLNASDLRAAGRALIEVLDPDGSERREEQALRRAERSAHLGRHLSIAEDGLGGVRVKGRGTVEDAAAIKAALFPLIKPLPASDPECEAAGVDPRDHSTRAWDALVELCQTVIDSETLPDSHGAKPRISLTMKLSDLQEGVGTGTLDTGAHVSASAVRRLACDADITAIVLGANSEILDVGRTQRLCTAAIWKALVVRDQCCSFPGCTRPPIACDAHHIKHWLDGGPTSLGNMALLCRAHHMTIHSTPWEIRLNPVDKRPEFLPPARLDPERRWVRERFPRE